MSYSEYEKGPEESRLSQAVQNRDTRLYTMPQEITIFLPKLKALAMTMTIVNQLSAFRVPIIDKSLPAVTE